jgi:hypothetical protein
MSIFQGTLDKYVQDQLKAREIIISQGQYIPDPNNPDKKYNNVSPYGLVSRDSKFLQFTTGKNSWVRMTSFVNVTKIIGSKKYSGDELARKYILEGGTLFEDPTNPGKFNLRSGVAKQSSVYGGNIDDGGNRPFGYRPMPGIASAQIVNKSAYGSLREANVKFYCWDKHQLEELELLFMRTGYSILLEWGWSQYLNSKDLSNITIENFNTPTINTFNIKSDSNLSPDEVIYRQIESLNRSTYGNYDAMLGYIKNFSWQIMPNGGYDCTTILISRGEIISTIKVSSNNNSANFTSGNLAVPTLSQFEQILFNYSALINGSENKRGGQFSYIPPTEDVENNNPLSNQITPSTTEAFLFKLKELNSKIKLFDDGDANWNSALDTEINTPTNNYGGCTLLTAGTTYENGGYGIEYIRMDIFIALLNFYFNFKDEDNKIIADIRIPKYNTCLASSDTVSVDPTTCIIKNTKAKKILLQDDTFGPGFDPKVVSGDYDPDTGNVTLVVIKEFLKTETDNRGYISNIYLAIPKLIEIYRSKMQNNSEVITTEYLKQVLNQVSRALGGINNFQLYTTKSSAQIIDVKYLEEGLTSKDKYEFDLLGLKSICRDIKIQSRIFESQSTMIAIAAQDTSNVGDLYSSTQVYLNEGLTDRLIPKKFIYNDGSSKTYAEQVYSVIANLGYYLRTKVLADPSLVGGIIPPPPPPSSSSPPSTSPPSTSPPPTAIPPTSIQRIVVPKPEEISNAVSALKTYLYQVKGYELQYKAIIPFELEITLDGLAGCVQGQVFKINENILPYAYSESGIGFIITGISHSLQNNDWITVIKTQICVLDADSKKQVKPEIPFSTLKKIAVANQEASYIIFAIADYLTEIFLAAAEKEQINTIKDPNITVNGKIIIGATHPATKFTDIINNVRVGNLKDFNTYLNYWHPKELAAVGSSASAIKFPSTVAKMLNPTGDANDKFNTSWVDNLVYDLLGGNIAIPGGTLISSPPIKGNQQNVYRNYSFLGRKNPNLAVVLSNSAGAPGGSEIEALKTAGKSNLDVLIHNTQLPSTNVMDFVTGAYSTLVEDIKNIVGPVAPIDIRPINTWGGIIKVQGTTFVRTLGGVSIGDIKYYINKPTLRHLILRYLKQLMDTNLKVPLYSRPVSFPDLNKIIPISYDPTILADQDKLIKEVKTM